MRRRLDAVSALASALCEALPRARLAELAGAPGRDVPASFGVVARSSFASRSVALARASEPPPRAHPPARRFQRARAAPRVHWPAREDARRFQRAHDALRFARLASADDRARPAARARSSAIAGEGPALARRLLVDARASFAYRGEDGVVTRACAARAAQAWALVCELAASDASGWVPERDATSAELAGAGDILRALVDVDVVDDDVNDDAPVAARAACDSPPDVAFALAAFALPEAWSLAQLTLANADAGGGEVDDVKPPEGLDAGGGSHPRDVVERLSASPLPFAAWRRSARARFVHLPRVDAESRLYAFAARGDVGRGATHTIEDAGVGAGGGAGGGGNDRNSVGKEKLGRRDIPDGRDDLDAPSDASWAVAAEILAAWGAVAAAGGGAPADETHARCVFRVAAACADELSSRGFSSRRGYAARRREGPDGSNPPPGGRRSFEGLSADVSRLTSDRVAALARASISAARRMARAYERDPDAASRALIPPKELYALCRARERSRRERGRGRGRNRRRGGLAEADEARGGLADALGPLALAEAEATADALALWALVLDGGGRPYREAFLPTQTWWAPPPPAGVPRGGPPPKTKSNGSEAFSPNQPGFRAAVEALHREAGRGGDARLGLGDEASERRVRRRLDDVAATAWTSFLDRGMPIDRRDVRAVTRRVARAHEGSLLGPEPPAGGPASTRPGAEEEERVGALEDDALGRSTRALVFAARVLERDPRAEMSRRDVAAILAEAARRAAAATPTEPAALEAYARDVAALVAAAGSVARRWRDERRWRADDDEVDQKRLRDETETETETETEIADDSNADAGSSPTPRGTLPAAVREPLEALFGDALVRAAPGMVSAADVHAAIRGWNDAAEAERAEGEGDVFSSSSSSSFSSSAADALAAAAARLLPTRVDGQLVRDARVWARAREEEAEAKAEAAERDSQASAIGDRTRKAFQSSPSFSSLRSALEDAARRVTRRDRAETAATPIIGLGILAMTDAAERRDRGTRTSGDALSARDSARLADRASRAEAATAALVHADPSRFTLADSAPSTLAAVARAWARLAAFDAWTPSEAATRAFALAFASEANVDGADPEEMASTIDVETVALAMADVREARRRARAAEESTAGTSPDVELKARASSEMVSVSASFASARDAWCAALPAGKKKAFLASAAFSFASPDGTRFEGGVGSGSALEDALAAFEASVRSDATKARATARRTAEDAIRATKTTLGRRRA